MLIFIMILFLIATSWFLSGLHFPISLYISFVVNFLKSFVERDKLYAIFFLSSITLQVA